MNTLYKPFHLTPFEKDINQKANVNWDDIIAYVNDLAIGGVSIADASDGWANFPIIPTYVSSTSMKFSGVDYTGTIQKGDKLYIDQSGNKYFYITDVSFSTDTTVTVAGGSDYTVANAVIVNPQFSKLATPQGFPLRHNWTPTYAGFSSDPTVSACVFSVSGGFVNLFYKLDTAGTSNAVTFQITGLPITAGLNDNGNGVRQFLGIDNGNSIDTICGYINGTTLVLGKTVGVFNSWTASGVKCVFGFCLSYPM